MLANSCLPGVDDNVATPQPEEDRPAQREQPVVNVCTRGYAGHAVLVTGPAARSTLSSRPGKAASSSGRRSRW
jgi:hypothetical protein